MQCIHKPASYLKILTQGYEGMVCRHCRQPIRPKAIQKADNLRRALVLFPAIILCVLLAFSEKLPGGLFLPICFIAGIAVTVIGWLIICRFVLEYEAICDEPQP